MPNLSLFPMNRILSIHFEIPQFGETSLDLVSAVREGHPWPEALLIRSGGVRGSEVLRSNVIDRGGGESGAEGPELSIDFRLSYVD